MTRESEAKRSESQPEETTLEPFQVPIGLSIERDTELLEEAIKQGWPDWLIDRLKQRLTKYKNHEVDEA